jgi:hypothetical protein
VVSPTEEMHRWKLVLQAYKSLGAILLSLELRELSSPQASLSESHLVCIQYIVLLIDELPHKQHQWMHL